MINGNFIAVRTRSVIFTRSVLAMFPIVAGRLDKKCRTFSVFDIFNRHFMILRNCARSKNVAKFGRYYTVS